VNANALAGALVAELRSNWRRWSVIGAGGLVALVVIYKVLGTVVLSDENRPAAEVIVAAIEAFNKGNKRYPENLAQLQPKYLGKIPLPARGTNFVYAVSSDGTAAWFAYQTSGGGLKEYGSGTRKWREVDYYDSDALRTSTREFVIGPK
jgi:hypothetical protein